MCSQVTRVAKEISILLRMANTLPHLRILVRITPVGNKATKGVFDQSKPFDGLKSNISEYSV